MTPNVDERLVSFMQGPEIPPRDQGCWLGEKYELLRLDLNINSE